ncbi:Siah2p [Homalodisca vitripennis]|nr:Siah2p [Homalodisca vitripennis]
MVNRSFQKILDIARCAVCLETARPEIVQCEGEHILCGDCSKHLNECPTCKRPFSLAKPARFMSQVLDALPKLCKHTNCGVYVSDDDEHEKWCGFQSTKCIVRNTCPWTGPNRDILSHVQDHPSVTVHSEHKSVVKIKDQSLVTFPISAFGQFFWALFNVIDENKISSTVRLRLILVPNGKPSEEYFFEVSHYYEKQFFKSKFKCDFEEGPSFKKKFGPLFKDTKNEYVFEMTISKE